METINKSVCRGVAGRRSNATPKGVVIHNDAGSVNATAKHYVQALQVMTDTQLSNGFAHYYIDRNTIARVEDTYNKAWHTANDEGNAWYVGYEVCQSIGASEKDFLANEQATFKQVAEDMKYWGMKPNRNTVKLHREFVATACPHRSWELHGKDVNKVKDYFIKEIEKYMSDKAEYWSKTGAYELLKDDCFYCEPAFKNKSTWKMKKGSVICVDEIVKYGSVNRGAVMLGKTKRYITLNKKLIKKV